MNELNIDNTRFWLYGPKLIPEPKGRMEKAQVIAEEGKVSFVGKLWNGVQYSVAASKEGGYDVIISKDIKTRSCTCPDKMWKGGDCKHILAAAMYLLYEQIWGAQFQAEKHPKIKASFLELAKLLKERADRTNDSVGSHISGSE